MVVVLMAVAVGALALCAVSIVVSAVLSARALRRGADFEAEMRAASFGYRLHMRPPGSPEE
ncbi:MAG TPA: hypothetical protein VKB03_11275 [Conexibacter sp.]|nr:hypothetical protein [Conexibacter sp.]